MAEELHDEGGAGAGRGGEGCEDQLDGGLLWNQRSLRVGSWIQWPPGSPTMEGLASHLFSDNTAKA